MRFFNKAAVWLASLPIWAYRRLASPVLPMSCRYHPTCSRYALDALRLHGPVKGSILAARRVARCHPWAEGGIDPAPEKLRRPRLRRVSHSNRFLESPYDR